MQPLDSVSAGAQPLASSAERAPEKSSKGGFGELVTGLLRGANRDQLEAEHVARELAAGRADIVDAMLGVSRADLSMRFVVSLRNRALEAYNEIMRLQV